MEITKHVSLRISDCLEAIKEDIDNGVQYDAIITDPPYEIALYAKEWDNTGVSFSSNLWQSFMAVMKPGAFVMAFSAPRLYHRLAFAAEMAGFTIYPHLSWNYGNTGMPKPMNVSVLFDRDNIPDRQPIGYRRRSGYAKALVTHGAQQYTDPIMVPLYEECVSQEAKLWKGYYYGLNCLKPEMETILLAQKPVAEKRTIDNIRKYGTGALNLSSDGPWPTTVFHCPKAKRSEHNSSHPAVKPLALMERLCRMGCPQGGRILDPFAGTGTTAVAAQNVGQFCTLVELDPNMESIIRSRFFSSDSNTNLNVK